MKKLFLIIFVLMTMAVFAQQTMPCTQIGVSNLAGQNPYITGSCLEVNSDLHVNNKNVIMEADNRIHFGPGTRVSLVQQGNFHASIRPNALQMAWIEPGTVGSVGQFKKLELGIKLNSEIESLIDEFIAAGKSDVALRTNPSLNPFDPDEIDVYAEFYYQLNSEILSGPYRQNGFFFEDFVRNTSDPDPVNWTWDKVQSDYRFRVRFTPRATGTWKCRIIANIAGFGQFSTSFFTFNVTPSDGHDFVSVGPNKRFLKIGSEPFFPVGMNLTDQQCYVDNNGTPDNPADDFDPYGNNCLGFVNSDVTGELPSLRLFKVFEQELDAYADAGANYFKMDLLSWFNDIEFEKVCNYYDRLFISYELDNIIKKAEERGLFIHFNTQIQYALEEIATYNNYYWDWTANEDYDRNYLDINCFNENDDMGYCYNSDLNLSSSREFFTSEIAKMYYKNKLRYLIARYGYSTNIAAFETFNESNGTCSKIIKQYNSANNTCSGIDESLTRPYFASDGTEYIFRNNLYNWQNTMISFMKQAMGANKHILSVNYLTDGYLSGDGTYFLDNVDLITSQQYKNFPDIYQSIADYINDVHDNPGNAEEWRNFDKPYMPGEMGSSNGYTFCDNDATWIRDLWIGAFTGICGGPLLWENQHKRELWPHFGRLRAFVAGYDFDESNGDQKGWIPYHDYDKKHHESGEPKPGIVDLFYLRSPDKKSAVGVLANRTYNWYSQWDVAKCGAYVWSGDDDDHDSIPDIQEEFELTSDNLSWNNCAYNSSHTAYYINESLQVDVKSKKTYIVTYFNAFTLQVIGGEEKYNATGKLNLNFPFITGTSSRPIILFTVEPKNKDKSAEQYLDSIRKQINAVANDFRTNDTNNFDTREARIFPNPAGEYINIELPGNEANCRIELFSSTGMLVKSDEFSGITYKLSLDGIDRGLFILRLTYYQKIETFKLIVE